MSVSSGGTVRTTVVLPVETLETLKRLVSARKRSEFIAEAVESRLKILRQREAMEAAFGVCKDEDYAHWRTPEDVRNYIREMRDPKNWRSAPLPWGE